MVHLFRRRSSPRLLTRNGQWPNLVRLGDRHTPWRDPYHLLLTMPWWGFIALLLVAYLLINGTFAWAYGLGEEAIANTADPTWIYLFFFSVQTLSSVGYGAMYPQTLHGHWLVVLESFVGLLFIAMATGVAFARFSIPTARLRFTQYAVVAPVNGIPTLMFRTANQRRNRILEAQLWVTLVRDETTTEGESFRRFYDLKLVRAHTPLFALTWTAMHPIDIHSPLYGITAAALAEQHGEILVILTGIDETISQSIHARHAFGAEEILWGYRFADILRWQGDRRTIDYGYFDQVLPLPTPPGEAE